jgi:HlyD family secretion protein
MAQLHRNLVLSTIGVAVAGSLAFVTLRPEPVPVDLHTVSRADFEITVDVDGRTRVADLYEVAAPIAGIAQRAPVEVGERVIAGETVVARVEPSSSGLLDARSRLQAQAVAGEAEAALNVAETERTKAQEDYALAASQYDRIAQLVERRVASIAQLEEVHQRRAAAEAAVQAAEARIGQAKSGLDRALAALVDVTSEGPLEDCCVPILAPANGVVLEIDQVSARPVAVGTRLLSIGDPSRLEIVADVLSSDAVRLPAGATAYVERWGGDTLLARLERIEPAARTKVSALGIEEQRVDAVFEIVSPEEERGSLGHGFAVYLRVVEFREEGALIVPLSSAFRTDDGWAVFRTEGDVVRRAPVELGRRNGRDAVVVSGLEEGDVVVEHPSTDLGDGSRFVERETFGKN